MSGESVAGSRRTVITDGSGIGSETPQTGVNMLRYVILCYVCVSSCFTRISRPANPPHANIISHVRVAAIHLATTHSDQKVTNVINKNYGIINSDTILISLSPILRCIKLMNTKGAIYI
jgi:hypothetical protein